MSDLDPTPGSGIAALAGKRKAIPPPPLTPAQGAAATAPVDGPTGEPTPHGDSKSRAAEPASTSNKTAAKNTAKRKPAKKSNRQGSDSNTEALLGSKVAGNRRRLGVRMPLSTRELLDEETERRQCSLGFAAMAAVRQEHRRIRDEHATEPLDDGFAAPRTKRTPRQPGPKVVAGILVTPEEAAALQDLADHVGWSVNRVIVESIESAFRVQ